MGPIIRYLIRSNCSDLVGYYLLWSGSMFTESTQSGKRLSKRNHKQQGKDHFRVKSYDKLSERQKNLWIKFYYYCRVKMANISNLGSVISNIDDIEKGNSQKIATQITNRRECQKSICRQTTSL